MADCMFHGYSGGPGECQGCAQEEKAKVPQGSSRFAYDPDVTMDAYRNGRYTPAHNGVGGKPRERRD
jgi:hypothetical protein